MDMIPLRQALTEMDNGLPFSLKFVAFNKSKRTGGNFMYLESCVKASAKYSLKDNDMISVKRTNNSTHPIPVHTYLITEFNNKRIML